MSSLTKRPLAKTSTLQQTGFSSIWDEVGPHTTYGSKLKAEFKPFVCGEEEVLSARFDDMDRLTENICSDEKLTNSLLSEMCELKEIGLSVKRSASETLTVPELFTMKGFLVHTRKIRLLLAEKLGDVPERYTLSDTDDLLDVMDPSGEYMDTFFIYDAFSEKLAALRKESREAEVQIRRAKKEIRQKLQAQHGFMMTPKFELAVPRSNKSLMALAESIPELVKDSEDYMNVVFVIKSNDEIYEIEKKQTELNGQIEDEELAVCGRLSAEISERSEALARNCSVIGSLDLDLAKCLYAKARLCVRPQLAPDHIIEIKDGRNLQVEEILKAQGRAYVPVSISLKDGVTAITGANMGGKTISLKMVAQTALLTQYAMYVPAKEASVGLSNFIQVLIGDSQNVQRGLSSFGSEMEELKEILDNAVDRSIIMIDEIASGTNPTEGLALTKSFMKYFGNKPYITLITTHFDHASVGEGIRNLQVTGLSGADFGKLARELSVANRRQRIEILGKYMDYRLKPVEGADSVPRDALNIAKILGVYDEIIDEAKNYLV